MIVNIIMFFTMYPVLLVLYFCFRGQYQYADGCLFAVNMKPEWIKEPEVAAIVEKFRREMKQYFPDKTHVHPAYDLDDVDIDCNRIAVSSAGACEQWVEKMENGTLSV